MNILRSLLSVNSIGVSSMLVNSPVLKLKSAVNSVSVLLRTSSANNAYIRFSNVRLYNRYILQQPRVFCNRNLSINRGQDGGKAESSPQSGDHKKINRREQLKIAVRDYGATVIVFHVGISLTSLGICYVLISNGFDAAVVLKAVGFSESIISSKVALGGSTFVIAYAVHKLFAPLRIAITLSATPFIVRYLRRVGILKMPKSS